MTHLKYFGGGFKVLPLPRCCGKEAIEQERVPTVMPLTLFEIKRD
jgi:hypothetical protein